MARATRLLRGERASRASPAVYFGDIEGGRLRDRRRLHGSVRRAASGGAGARVVLVEAETAAFAASGRNGGQIRTGLRKSQPVLEKELGVQHARDLWDLNEKAKALIA